ncbi:aminoglycoside adenylyltransferase domain-containing protein [Streptomyces sp. NPDC058694]|uniref:aminoglycoside adenylyltransferase domain-containing protein n=1 Tax=Streptomyces sp. NPDC058694 TaxID=3346603 RepID=UPI003650E063
MPPSLHLRSELIGVAQGDVRPRGSSTPCRTATCGTGAIISKDAAASWVLDRLPDRHRPVRTSMSLSARSSN